LNEQQNNNNEKPVKPIYIRQINDGDKAWVASLINEMWGSVNMVVRGSIYHVNELPGFIAILEDEPVGLVTYFLEDGDCEIISLDSTIEGIGMGSTLIETMKKLAREEGCKRLRLITTNDNTNALRFWQKRGFRLAALYPNAIEKSRELKPEIPVLGNDDIPIRDEIELELIL
jgi:ribosomal protein S18 acetylase RimI-like enzyme